jgi:hypothetical protein
MVALIKIIYFNFDFLRPKTGDLKILQHQFQYKNQKCLSKYLDKVNFTFLLI